MGYAAPDRRHARSPPRGIFGLVEGREEHEQPVVAIFPWPGAAVRHTQRNDLRGARLPAILMSSNGRRARPAVPRPLTTSLIACRT